MTGDLVWDERLISRDEAWKLAAGRSVRPGIRKGLVFADCGECGQAVLVLGSRREPFTFTLETLRDAVLRHAVSAHGMALNHRRGHGGDQPGAARGDAGIGAPARPRGDVSRRDGIAAARARHPSAAGRRAGEPGPAGGDRA